MTRPRRRPRTIEGPDTTPAIFHGTATAEQHESNTRQGRSIRKFTKVFASSFAYDANGAAKWPALAISYTTKTRYLFRINKGWLRVHDHGLINDFVPHEDRPMPFSNIVFIGDGETDIPCMRLVREQGGHSIAVY